MSPAQLLAPTRGPENGDTPYSSMVRYTETEHVTSQLVLQRATGCAAHTQSTSSFSHSPEALDLVLTAQPSEKRHPRVHRLLAEKRRFLFQHTCAHRTRGHTYVRMWEVGGQEAQNAHAQKRCEIVVEGVRG